ncbi:MAG: hypothetical protein R2713_23495 [Ilumatobacteraceae bacterium]
MKNVSGFDVCRLLVGSWGTLGFLGDVILRTGRSHRTRSGSPATRRRRWRRSPSTGGVGAVGRLAGARAARRASPRRGRPGSACRPPRGAAPPMPPSPRARHLFAPSAVVGVTASLEPGTFLAELGLGVGPRRRLPLANPIGVAAIEHRMKARFDPAGRLNPGVAPGAGAASAGTHP